LWFTEAIGNKIGRITPDGTITEYSLPTPNYTYPGKIAGGTRPLKANEHAGARDRAVVCLGA